MAPIPAHGAIYVYVFELVHVGTIWVASKINADRLFLEPPKM